MATTTTTTSAAAATTTTTAAAAAAATTAAAITTPIANAAASKASNTVQIVDASLWWNSFTLLLTDLENISPSSDLPPPLEKKLKENHVWFFETFRLFKPSNQKSKEALDADTVKIGSHQLTIESQLRDLALKISSVLCLDEVQSYILVKRSMEHNPEASETMQHELLHLVVLHYYVERQCLFKCIQHILVYSLYVETGSKEGCVLRELAQKLIADGLENSLLTVFEELLRCNYPEHMDVDLYILWAEETLIEANLILDIIFLAYYESLCTCTGKQWKKLCLLYEGVICDSYNLGKLAISAEAIQSISHAKVQLLLILIETLDLESLLQMIHDNTPFRQGFVAFSLTDIREMDVMIAGLNAFERREAGPLILAWAVFLCLVSSLPEKPENCLLMDIDHVAYVRQAIEAACLSYFLEILDSDMLKDPESPVAGYRSVARTLISAFIASYEISLQLEDSNLKLILDILCRIYRGEESLCTQFWDKDSFVDGPIRCLLCNLEGEFPLRTLELVSLLSALSEGAWPAECVFNFLNKSVGLSTLFDIRTGSMVDEASLVVENHQPYHVPGVEGLIIPRRTRGHIIKMIDENIALVRWEHTHSGVLFLLLRVAQGLYMDNSKDTLVILNLLSRLVTSNTAVCYALMTIGSIKQDQVISADDYLENHMRIDVVEIVCSLVKNLASNSTGAIMMSLGVNILAKMLKCSPSHVSTLSVMANIFDVALKTNPFDIGSNGLSSGSWLLSGRLAKMLLTDCEQSDCMLTLSVLDFTMQLMQTGSENDFVFALIVFSLQYVLVNHEFWKYKVKHARWKVTLKVLDVLKECILLIPYHQRLSEAVRDILFCDSSIHNALFRIVCTTTEGLEKLYVSRLFEQMEIEGLQQAIYSGLDILSSMLSDLPQDFPVLPVFHQAILSPMTRPMPVVTAVISLISCYRNPKIQLGAVRLLSNLCAVADYSQGNTCFSLEDEQIFGLKNSISSILSEKSLWDEDLIVATFKLLTSAAQHQPAFLVTVMDPKEDSGGQACNAYSKQQQNEAGDGLLGVDKANVVDAVLLYVNRSDELIQSKPIILLNLLYFLKTLWHHAPQFTIILEKLRTSQSFWRQFLDSIMVVSDTQDLPAENLTQAEIRRIACRYQCQSDVLQLMAYEIFLQKKLVYAESLVKPTSDGAETSRNNDRLRGLRDTFSSWCKGKLLGDLIKSYTSCKYDNSTCLLAKVASCLFLVEVMRRLRAGNSGSLSISLVEKVATLLRKFRGLPAFSELLAHYTERGYSKGKDSHDLVITDLFYHLQGELEGRQIDHRPFKELLQYLMDTKFLLTYQQKRPEEFLANSKDVYLYDSLRLRADMGLDMWDYSEWKASKAVAEMMLGYMQDVNSMILLSSSKISALKALIAMLSLNGHYVEENKSTNLGDVPEQITLSCINPICQSLVATIESLTPTTDVSEDVLDILVAQAELLVLLVRSICQSVSLPDRVLILRSSGYGLKVLCGFRSSNPSVKSAMKFLLMLILYSVKLSSEYSQATEMESVEAFAEASNVSLGLLPVLCSCIELSDHCSLSLTAIDLILKAFSTPTTWFPIIQKHLRLRFLIHKLQDKNSYATVPVILKFLLTLARVREGADMILNAGFFASLRVLIASLSDDGPLPVIQNESSFPNVSDKGGKPQHMWGLSLAVVTAIIHSLGESPSDVVEYVMVYLFLEKAYVIYYYLSAPGFPSEDHEKKRARATKTHTSLGALKETEDTLMLMCLLAKHRNSWIKTMKEVDSQLRERIIHLLAFISRANQRHGESRGRVAPFSCRPILKEEFEWYRQPSWVNSKNGWFALSPLGCSLDPKFASLSSMTTALVVKDRNNQDAHSASATHFSDTAAIQIYRITFLLLKFLCLQAEGTAKRAEEVGFIDLTHFPELPMPDILHGLQDQGIAIVTELCEANKLKQVTPEIQQICLLLLQITIMALYLEFCVIQICGMRPVLGHVEDFSKELRLLLRATDGHAFLKESVKSLKQIVLFIYPELLQAEALF